MAKVSHGWYVHKKDPTDVVFVREESRERTGVQEGHFYQGLERGRIARRKELGPQFKRDYKSIDPRQHATKLYGDALSILVLYEAMVQDLDVETRRSKERSED
ncbi:MAG: hypothetical protein PHF67_02355 [Candidatus Nanoarchaeia archaeon]|nr:hypothetical protein [Candidatus Nanoarchaeia archaeon]